MKELENKTEYLVKLTRKMGLELPIDIAEELAKYPVEDVETAVNECIRVNYKTFNYLLKILEVM